MDSLGTKANTGALKSEFLPQCVFERADSTSESCGRGRLSLEVASERCGVFRANTEMQIRRVSCKGVLAPRGSYQNVRVCGEA